MDTKVRRLDESLAGGDAALSGLKVLALTSSGFAPEKHYIFNPLAAAKARWDWQIDLLCGSGDVPAFQKLAGTTGKLFTRPSLSDATPWERNSAIVAELDEKIRESELPTGVPVGQILLAADSKIGRAFVAPVINLPDNRTSQIAEKDNEEPFRAVRRLFHFAEELLDASNPDVVYSYEWAKPWLFTIWMAAQRRGIPCVVVRRSKLRSDSCFITADRTMFNVTARERAAALLASGGPVSDAAVEYIRAFREQPQMVQYIASKWRQVAAQKEWFTWHGQWARSTARNIARTVIGRKQKRKSDFKKLYDYNSRIAIRRLHRRFLRTFEEAELASMKYLLYPMHKETDLPVNFQAASWFDQRNTVRLLASVLPSGHKLLVREHRHNFGLRPTGYYQELGNLPNVVLLDAFDSQFKYIRNADLVVTENGSSGWEGLLLGRRVLTLSTTFYDGAGLARKVKHRDELGRVILDALSAEPVPDQQAYDRNLACMVDSEFETTFPARDDEASLLHFKQVLPQLLRLGSRRRH